MKLGSFEITSRHRTDEKLTPVLEWLAVENKLFFDNNKTLKKNNQMLRGNIEAKDDMIRLLNHALATSNENFHTQRNLTRVFARRMKGYMMWRKKVKEHCETQGLSLDTIPSIETLMSLSDGDNEPNV